MRNIKNEYFNSESNKENLSFVIEILKYFKIKKSILIKTIQKFKGLKYRQQIIFRNRSLTIINDSKSTSFSSSIGSLKTAHKIYWLLGGIPKKETNLNYLKNILTIFLHLFMEKIKNFLIRHFMVKLNIRISTI